VEAGYRFIPLAFLNLDHTPADIIWSAAHGVGRVADDPLPEDFLLQPLPDPVEPKS